MKQRTEEAKKLAELSEAEVSATEINSEHSHLPFDSLPDPRGNNTKIPLGGQGAPFSTRGPYSYCET